MKILSLSVCLILITLSGSAQKQLSAKIDVDFRNADIVSIVTEIEKQAEVKFYLDPSQFDSVSFTVSGQRVEVTQVLDRIFANSDYKYAVYKSKYIIITKGRQIYTNHKSYSGDKQQSRNPNQGDSVQLASNDSKLYVIGIPGTASRGKSFTLAGYVRDEKTGEPIVGASVQINNPVRRVVTDDFGYYTIEVPSGRHVFRIESMGMDDRNINLAIYDDGKLDFELKGRVTTLKNVVISREKLNNIKSAQMGSQRIDFKTIRQVPVVLGESDVLKVITTLPVFFW